MRKGYRLYDRDKGQIIISHNVRFDEDESMELLPTIETGRENREPAQGTIDLGDNEKSGWSEIDQEDEETVPAQQPQLRRSSKVKKPVKYYISKNLNVTIHQEPTSFKEAVKSTKKEQRSQAMDREMDSLKANKVWELTTLPPGKDL